MQGISKKEMELITKLESEKKYFFTSEEVDKIAKDKTQRYNIIKQLLKKKRIVKLNKNKYYLTPIQDPTEIWFNQSFILADEVMDGKDYFIGGWAAANYWRLTDQIPMKTEVYTTKRQGTKKFLNMTIIFRRTTKKKLKKAITKKIKNHQFKILNKEESKKWLSKRNY